MANPSGIGPLLTQGIRNEFSFAYQPAYQNYMAEISQVIWADATSDKISELYGFMNSPLHPVVWKPGDIIGSKSILSTQFRVQNRDFGRRVYLPRNYTDDQTGSVMAVSRGLGSNWAMLPERIFYQYIQNSTDNDLLPAVPTSADGNNLYVSSTRYGSSSGNTVTQTGSSTVQQIITDFFSVVRRFMEFQDTESQPFWPADIVRRNGVTVFYGSSLTLVMQQAAVQMLAHSTIAGSSTTDVQTGAATTNTIIASGIPVTWVPSQRITTTAIYTFLRGLPVDKRPIVRQVREGMTEAQGNWATSDSTRNTGEEYVQFKSREGWGSALAIGTIKTV